MKRNLFQYHYRPSTFFYKTHFTKVPFEPGSLKIPSQRHKPYSVNRGSGEATSDAGSTLGKNLPQFSLGKQKQFAKNMTVINLTERETKICDLLRKVTTYLKETKQLPPVELRIAGGWVRDKLLGFECHDLDVAINSLSGYVFANYIKEFLEKEGSFDEEVKIHLIESNPEKSKHLETATTKLFDLDIDFVNLRKEVYEVGSRIPISVVSITKEFGSPKEDADRRDITINALFYNIHTGQVEDFTEKGMSDLNDKLIRTPLSAHKTFKDDPLRVLRCIRFASKFQFEIVEDVKNAIMEDGSIKDALNEKISRERVGIEVDKMIKGPDPVQAINLIVNLRIYDAVFSPPPQETIVSGKLGDPKICLITANILKWLLSNESKDYNVNPIFHKLNQHEERALYLAACALPYKDMVYIEKKKHQPAYQYVIRESVKFSNDDVDKVKKLLSSIDDVTNAVLQNNKVLTNRAKLGFLIRELGSEWPTNLLFALSNELASICGKNFSLPEFGNMGQVKEINNKYTKFIERIYELELENVYSLKPILNGKDIQEILNIKAGVILKEILNSVMEWQLEYPKKNREECQEFIKDRWKKD